MKYLPNSLIHLQENPKMTKIFKIAKLELSVLFYSPVAWIALTIFMVQSGMSFLSMFGSFQEALAMGIPVDKLTFALFPGLNGLFDTVQQNLYLYIPLLTMGLMSREISSGSIKLLLSSPVKIREIVLGKYLAIVAYGLILIGILSIYAVAGIIIIKDPDVKLILSGMFGLFLLICTYAAIGLFMSSLTSYQVVAAISTLAVFAALRFVGSVGQGIDFVRDITYFLSLSGRADDMIKGLITTKDVFYFLIIIILFLSLCIRRMVNSRESKPLVVQISGYMVLIGVALCIGYLSTRPRLIGYLDMTATKSRTLTKASQEIVSKLDGPLEIITYVNLLDQNVYFGLPQSRNADLEHFEQFRRFIPDLSMKYVYYYDVTDLKNNRNMSYQGDLTGLTIKQIAEKVADNMGLDMDLFMPPSEIRKQIDLAPENNSLVRILRYKGKSSRLRFYEGIDQFPSEKEIAASIKRLVAAVPRIAFISGNNERSIDKTGDRNYQMMSTMKKGRNALINQGFDVIGLDLDKQNIPAGLTTLVLGDPTVPLKPEAVQKIKDYLREGGNMLITGEPGRQMLLSPILNTLGIAMKPGMLVYPSKDDTPELLFCNLKHGGKIAMRGAVALTCLPIDGFKVDSTVLSPVQGWNKVSGADLTSTDVRFNAADGDQGGSFPVVLSLSRNLKGKTQKIMVTGDADFMSNVELQHPRGFNEYFVSTMFKWFSNNAFPVNISRPKTTDDNILFNRKQISMVKTLLLGVIPALILAFGAVVLIKRKRN
jgi:ABC-2 type transport system permease protein